jgi:hypothetical protein
LFLLVTLFSIYYVKIQPKYNIPEDTLLKAFQSSGAKTVSMEMFFWSRLDRVYADTEQVKPVMNELASSLGIGTGSRTSNSPGKIESAEKIENRGISADGKTINISVYIPGIPEDGLEKYMSVDIIWDTLNDKVGKTRRDVEDIFKKYDMAPSVNSCITGCFDGEQNYEQLNEICRRILEDAEAHKVEGIRDNNLISVSAYSPAIGSYVTVNEKKINLNVAMRYNAYENKTYIWLATPVITTGY